MDLYRIVNKYVHQVLPHQVVVSWLGDYKRPNDKIKAMGDEGLLLPIKKGLYIAGSVFDTGPEPFLVANHILGPSYVSEDLDFSLLQPDPDFSLNRYQDAIAQEFEALGMKVSVREKKKSKESNIDSTFLKSETIWKELVLEGMVPQNGIDRVANIKIKIEVDREPPLKFETEEKLLLRPFSFYVKCFTLPYLFAGKMHACFVSIASLWELTLSFRMVQLVSS